METLALVVIILLMLVRLRSVPNRAVSPFLEFVIGSSIGSGFTLENKHPK